MSDLVASRLGLHFAPARRPELERGLIAATEELGFEDLASCVRGLLSAAVTTAQLHVLAIHLTIGETYFFRDAALFDVLRSRVLPQLIHRRRGSEQRLRIWSAASCSGEEPYSLAILLHELLPDLHEWQVTITATDVNPRFLAKAAAGIYREWSFRQAPSGIQQRYFERTPDGAYAIRADIRKLVTFSHLNLVEDAYPSLMNGTNAMDLIFCRNVLMYFTPAQMGRVVEKLHHALVDDGVLAVSPSETSQAVFSEFLPVNHPGVVLYRKSAASARAAHGQHPSSSTSGSTAAVRRQAAASSMRGGAEPAHMPPAPARHDASAAITLAQGLHGDGRYLEAAETLMTGTAEQDPQPEDFARLARSLANEGRLADALLWCERWIALDKVDPAAHYLRAMVILENGNTAEAQASLRTALFLSPHFVLAHFALGNLARAEGNRAACKKHFNNALRLLRASDPESLIPESDGLTAGRLAQTITATTELEEMR